MVTALLQQIRPQCFPIESVAAADIAEGFVDACLHALQAAQVQIGVFVAQQARHIVAPRANQILHVLPQDFVVDEQDGIGAPVGMTGARLEVNVHIVTGSQSSTQNIVACVNRAGVNVAETVVEQLAASESVLTTDEKELGVALTDEQFAKMDYERRWTA